MRTSVRCNVPSNLAACQAFGTGNLVQLRGVARQKEISARLIAAVVVAVALLALALPNPADAKMPRMTISSEQLPHTITATWPDTVAFWEAEGSPTRLRLVDVPAKLGPKYEVLS